MMSFASGSSHAINKEKGEGTIGVKSVDQKHKFYSLVFIPDMD